MIDFQSLIKRCEEISNEHTSERGRSSRDDLFVDPSEFGKIKSFMQSDTAGTNQKRGMVLIGPAGIGKSNILWRVYEEVKKARELGLILNARRFQTASIKDELKRELQRTDPSMDLCEVYALLNAKKAWLPIFIDSVNEYDNQGGPLALLQSIITMVESVSDSARLKIIVACRTELWSRYAQELGHVDLRALDPKVFITPDDSGSAFQLGGFQTVDEREELYAKFQIHYSLRPVKFKQLGKSCRELIRRPLMMRMIAETYSNRGSGHVPGSESRPQSFRSIPHPSILGTFLTDKSDIDYFAIFDNYTARKIEDAFTLYRPQNIQFDTFALIASNCLLELGKRIYRKVAPSLLDDDGNGEAGHFKSSAPHDKQDRSDSSSKDVFPSPLDPLRTDVFDALFKVGLIERDEARETESKIGTSRDWPFKYFHDEYAQHWISKALPKIDCTATQDMAAFMRKLLNNHGENSVIVGALEHWLVSRLRQPDSGKISELPLDLANQLAYESPEHIRKISELPPDLANQLAYEGPEHIRTFICSFFLNLISHRLVPATIACRAIFSNENSTLKGGFSRIVLDAWPNIDKTLFATLLHSIDGKNDGEIVREIADSLGVHFVREPDRVLEFLEKSLQPVNSISGVIWKAIVAKSGARVAASLKNQLKTEASFLVKFLIIATLLGFRSPILMEKLKDFLDRKYSLLVHVLSESRTPGNLRLPLLLRLERILSTRLGVNQHIRKVLYRVLSEAGINQWDQAIGSQGGNNKFFVKDTELGNTVQREELAKYLQYMIALHNEDWRILSLEHDSAFRKSSMALFTFRERSVVGFVASVCVAMALTRQRNQLRSILEELERVEEPKTRSARFHEDLLMSELVYMDAENQPTIMQRVQSLSQRNLTERPAAAIGYAFVNVLAKMSADQDVWESLRAILDNVCVHHADNSTPEVRAEFAKYLSTCCYHPNIEVGRHIVLYILERDWLKSPKWESAAHNVLAAFLVRDASKFEEVLHAHIVETKVLEEVLETVRRLVTRDMIRERHKAIYQWGWSEFLAYSIADNRTVRRFLVRDLLGGLVRSNSVPEFAEEFRRLIVGLFSAISSDVKHGFLRLDEAEVRDVAEHEPAEGQGKEWEPRRMTREKKEELIEIRRPGEATNALSTISGTPISWEPICRVFDRTYMGIWKPRTCNNILPCDLFDGKEFTIDSFVEEHEKYYDTPGDFYVDFSQRSRISLRTGLHPRERSRSRGMMKHMLFSSPMQTKWSETNLAPLKWFSDPDHQSKTVLIFVPGWGRKSQSIEEKFCSRLLTHGIDSMLMTVPYHQARAPEGSRSGEYFISANVFWTIANFRHLVAEIRQLIQFCRTRYDYVGLVGQSSGGFQANLAATAEKVDFLFSYITGCKVADITWNGRLTRYVKADLINKKKISLNDLRKVWTIADCDRLGEHCKATYRKHYIALHDTVVPPEYQIALWDKLGRHDRLDLPMGHHSSYFFLNDVADDVARFVKRCLPR